MTSWKCPYCYRCPFLKNKNGDKMTTTLETLFERLQIIGKCNEDLKDSANTIDFFNSHIEHLILNDIEFKNRNER